MSVPSSRGRRVRGVDEGAGFCVVKGVRGSDVVSMGVPTPEEADEDGACGFD